MEKSNSVALKRTWSTKGCKTLDPYGNSSSSICSCNHNTSFAILLQDEDLDTKEIPVDDSEPLRNYGLSLLSTLMGSISIFCLGLTLVLFTFLNGFFKSLQVKVHANLAVSLLTAQILFFTHGFIKRNLIECNITTLLLRFLFGATCCWMLVEGTLLLQKVVMVTEHEPPSILTSVQIGLGVPFIITLITFAVGIIQFGINGICWLSNHDRILPFFCLAVVVILVDIILVTLVWSKWPFNQLDSEPQLPENLRASFSAMVVLVPILGLTWVFGFLQSTSPVFGYLFVIFNSFQGIFIFICYGLMNKEMQMALNRRSIKVSPTSQNMFELTRFTKLTTINPDILYACNTSSLDRLQCITPVEKL